MDIYHGWCDIKEGVKDLDFARAFETKNLAQLDQAFSLAAARREPIESVHHSLDSLVSNLTFALYRDFPDAQRHEGEEKF